VLVRVVRGKNLLYLDIITVQNIWKNNERDPNFENVYPEYIVQRPTIRRLRK